MNKTAAQYQVQRAAQRRMERMRKLLKEKRSKENERSEYNTETLPVKEMIEFHTKTPLLADVVFNYVRDEEGDFCYCPKCGHYVLVKESYCPICDNGEELVLEFAHEYRDDVDFLRASAGELRGKGWLVIDVNRYFDYKGVVYYISEVRKDGFCMVYNTVTGFHTKIPTDFIVKVFQEKIAKIL